VRVRERERERGGGRRLIIDRSLIASITREYIYIHVYVHTGIFVMLLDR